MAYWSRAGGHNRTHNRTTQYVRIDSRIFANAHRLMNNNNSEQMMYAVQGTTIIVRRDCVIWDGYIIRLDFVKNGFGGNDRVYMLCPYCKKRYQFLYEMPVKGRKFPLCRNCGYLHYPSSQRAHGWQEAAERMMKQLEKMEYDITDVCYGDAEYITPPRPKWQRKTTYNKNLETLRKLQESYNKEWLKSAWAIVDKHNIPIHQLPELLFM